ncbi:hypothetical protein LOK49_LG01G00209 [Camellia lanceoleosa]|uniref:Uncharacterized protein n=1 Tax=Camellia lanceoleosa TaxID=1840588 RepID=A0ACC0J438_9ERIC|nr:hypothetical protein LOK49_LG01G00209 [Camellia lanceoleosa]
MASKSYNKIIDIYDDLILQFFPQREQLQQQYHNKVHAEPFNCLFKDTCMKNVVLDPDIPHGCDENSPEFELQPGVKPKIGSRDRDDR